MVSTTWPTKGAEVSHWRSRSLRRVRSWVDGHRQLAWSLRAVRAVLHFGPWRHLFRAAIRIARPAKPSIGATAVSLLPPIDVEETVSRLRRESVHVAGVLPSELLSRIRRVTDRLPREAYGHAHEGNPDIHALVNDPGILSVVRAHLGCEPELLECTISIVGPSPSGSKDNGAQRSFHFDFGGWHSLNLFVYLTDVDADAAPHEVAAGTHRKRRLADAVRTFMSDEEAYRRFGPDIRTITGPAGTMFFEDTEAMHRRAAATRPRVMLNVLYASHRGFLSHGRPGLSLAAHLAAAAAKEQGASPE